MAGTQYEADETEGDVVYNQGKQGRRKILADSRRIVFGASGALPEMLFNILSSPNKELYAQSLFILRDAFRESMLHRKDELIGYIAAELEPLLEQSDLSEEGDTETLVITASEKARIVFNRLKETGWLEVEFNDFEGNVTLPAYSLDLMNVLYEIAHPQKQEYRHYTYGTYSDLVQTENSPEFRFSALISCVKRTEEFNNALTKLHSNIRKYHESVAVRTANETLSDLLERYQEEVARIIGPIRVNDAVPKFKNAILTQLEKWQEDESVLSSLIEQAMKEGSFQDPFEARDAVDQMISFVIESYNVVEGKISQIIRKDNSYTRASREKIAYDYSSAGSRDISAVVWHLVKNSSDDDELLEDMAKLAKLSSVKTFSRDSIYRRRENTLRDTGERLGFVVREPSDALKEASLSFVKSRYPDSAVDGYVLRNIKEGRSGTDQISLSGTEELILLILAMIRAGSASAPYDISFPHEGTYAERGFCSVPEAIFTLKEKGDAT